VKKRIFVKALSFVLCLAMLLPMAMMLPFTAAAASGSGASDYSSATTTETVVIDGVYYHIQRNVVYTGNSTYSLNIRVQTSLSESEAPLFRTSAENGYFTVQTTGYYLLELWGGNGSGGKGTADTPAGNGGAAGYVYARVWLEKGQTLAYSIGTNGELSGATDMGGGENGTGGGHGDTGRVAVGGGGGYSALYFFDEGDFNPAWLTADNTWRMPESIRVANYVMIAAGGGGGGANAANPEDYATDAAGNLKTADGGAGGSITNGVSLSLSGDAYPVKGYVFSGSNGKSNGTSNGRVGKGGTNLPGAGATTAAGFYPPSVRANDWTGTYTTTSDPGAGGSGNLRGGGGGAGYCGGGGGNMQALLSPINVGGGGGGSSFLASSFGDHAVAFGNSLTSAISKLLKGRYGLSDISGEGGAFCYTYIGDGSGDAVMDTSYLNSVTVEGKLSQYFTPISYYTSDGTVGSMGELTENGTITYDEETGAFKVVGANINTATLRDKGVTLSINFTIVPKAGFAGGNNVPLLDAIEEGVTLKATVTRAADDVFEVKGTPQADTDYVNVPLQLKIRTNSAVHSLSAGVTSVTLKGADLYEADYAAAIAAFSSNYDSNYPTWEYDFITKIASYRIYKGKNATSGTSYSDSSNITVTATTHYTVSIVVTVKTGTYAKVGPAITTSSNTVKGVATITLIGGNVFDAGWSYTITAKKSLTYQNGIYTFGQVTTQTLEREYQPSSYYTYSGTDLTYTQAFTATASGYYLLQAWGAYGGDGGEAHVSARTQGYNSDNSIKLGPLITRDASGGSGSSGTSYSGFVYLQAGDQLTITTGQAGVDGTSQTKGVNVGDAYNRSYYANGTGGGGGGYAAVSITRNGETQYLLITGGGGGGGGGGACCNCGTISMGNIIGGDTERNQHHGKSGSSAAAVIKTEFDGLDDYSGGPGNSGNAYIPSGQASQDWSGSPASGGNRGAIYVNTAFVNVGNTETEAIHMKRLAEAMVTQGGVQTTSGTENAAAQITYICAPETTELLNAFPGVQSTGSFTRYFDVVENANGYTVDMVINGRGYDQRAVEENGDVITVTYYKDEELVASFSYELVHNDDGTTSYEILSTVYHPDFKIVTGRDVPTYQATCEFTFAFSLKPTEGFMGGNDVPVLAAPVTISKGTNIGELAENPVTDYANVEIKYDLDSLFAVKDGYVVLGDADTANDSIDITALYTLGELIVPDDENAWKYDFIKLEAPAAATYKPTQTTTYNITAKIVPIAASTKAVISSDNEGLLLTKKATVYVKYPVTYNLSHMETTGEALVNRAEELRIKLTPEAGYTAPPAYDNETGVRYISLTVSGIDRNNRFTYDEKTGEFVIPASYVTGAVVITASAKKQLYKLTYVAYQFGATEDTPYYTSEEWYLADTPIDYGWMSDFEMPAVLGHTFDWEWGTDDGTQPTNMPAYNLLVVGRYVANRHDLTIRYQNSAGDPLAATYEVELPFGAAFNVLSPVIENYMATSTTYGDDAFRISGTMGDSDITVTVTYLYANNRLVILYVDRNGNEVAARYDQTLSEGAAYEVVSPAVEGYTVRDGYQTVSGTLEGSQSLTVRVYYDANRYTLNFEYRYEGNAYEGPIPEGTTLGFDDFSSATMEDISFEVEFGNLYIYNAVTGEYGLPTPLALGYVFAGWYADAACQTEITEQTLVTLPPHATLYAKWLPAKYMVTIRYDFVLDEGDSFPDDVIGQLPEGTLYHEQEGYYYYRFEFEIGEEYRQAIHTITGYKRYLEYGAADEVEEPTEIVGVMPAMPVVHHVTYVICKYTVTFTDVPGANITLPEGFADEVPAFDTLWQESNYSHGRTPVYSGAKPLYTYDATVNNSVTYQHYAFVFTGWKDAATGVVYAYGEALPAVTANVIYEACYEARENIAMLVTYQGTLVSYFPSLQSAVDAALAHTNASNSSRRPVVKLFRPLSGAASPIDLTVTEEDPTVTLSYSGVRYITLDLNGYSLTSNTTVLENSINLLLIDSVGGSAIHVAATGDVVGIANNSYPLTVGTSNAAAPQGITLNVSSTGGSATGFEVRGSVAYLYGCDITVSTVGSSNAYAVHVMSSSGTGYLYYSSLYAAATDGHAYGVFTKNTAYFYDDMLLSANTTGLGNAYGVYADNANLSINGSRISVHALAQGTGVAYGLYYHFSSNSYTSTVGATDTTISVTSAANDAYGVYYLSTTGSLYLGGTRVTLDVIANGGDAYGVHAGNLLLYGTDTVVNVKATGGNAYGLRCSAIRCTDDQTSVTAESVTGDATALTIVSGLYHSSYNGVTVHATAIAPNGTAIGISDAIGVAHVIGSTATVYTVSATGKNAIAVHGPTVNGAVTLYALLEATATTGEAKAIHLNGYDLTVGEGATLTATTESGTAYAVSHAKLQFAATTTAATLTAVSATGKAALLYNVTAQAPYSDTATLTVTTESGIAIGIYAAGGTSYTVNSPYAIDVTATAEGGRAYGAWVANTTLTLGAVLNVTGPAAFGAYVELNGTVTPQALATFTVNATQAAASGIYVQSGKVGGTAAFTVAVTSPVLAYGVYHAGTGSSIYASITATATGADATAYGVYNIGTVASLYGPITVNTAGVGYALYSVGTVNSLKSTLTVEAAANAYGVYTTGGQIATTVSGFRATVTSIEADAYGVYTEGGQIGTSGLSGSMRYGVITVVADSGTSYGLYAASGAIYVRGEELYYKADVPSTGITVCEGYSEVQKPDSDANYPLYHYLTAASYTITFVTNGGESVGQYTLKVDAYVNLPTTTRTGADFAGWYYDAELANKATLTRMPNYDLTLYAAWQVTVTFVDNSGATYTDPVTGLIGASLVAPEPIRSSYNFMGWYENADTTGSAYVLDHFPESHLTLYVKWEAKEVTITFVTNGGSEIAPITGKAGESVYVSEPTRPGYYFSGWYSDAGLTQYYSLSYFPETDITLYAAWGMSVSLILLGEYTECTVRLVFGDLNMDGVIGTGEYQDYAFPADSFYQHNVGDWWLYSSLPDYLASQMGITQPMRVKGWFTAPEGGVAVNLASGIGTWGVEPVDGMIKLYPQLVPLDNAESVADMWANSEGGNEMDLDGDGVSEQYHLLFSDEIPTALKGAEGGYRYYTYKSFRRGEHKILFVSAAAEASVTVTHYGLDGEVIDVLYEGVIPSLGYADMDEHMQEIYMEEGETLELRVYISNAEDTNGETVICLAQLPNYETLTSEEELFAMYNVDDYVIYSAAMGTVMLPVNGTPGFDGVTGWKYKEGGVPSSETLTSITPALLEKTEIWQDMGGLFMLQLYPYQSDTLLGWVASIMAGRHFNPGALLDAEQQLSTVLRDNGGMTFTFLWEGLMASTPSLPPTYTLGTLCFTQGLPAGTTLTVIDLSAILTVEGDEMPAFAYYSYVVGEDEAGITELALDRFTAFGSNEPFAGFATVMVFNLSFAGAQTPPSSGEVFMKLDGTRTSAELSYTVKATAEQTLDNQTVVLGESLNVSLKAPTLTGQGYADEDKVLLLFRMAQSDGTPVALPANLVVSAPGVFLYSEFAGVLLGTVGDIPAGAELYGQLDMSALRYHNFSGKLYYEVVVVPADTDLTALSCLGIDTSVHTRYETELTVIDAPTLTILENKETHATNKGTAQQGDTLALTVYASNQSSGEISLYVYQTVNGQMQYTRACATLLEGVSVDQYGHATFDDGAPFTCGEAFTLTVKATPEDGSPGAAPGVYFLVAYLGGSYAVYTLTVTE